MRGRMITLRRLRCRVAVRATRGLVRRRAFFSSPVRSLALEL